MRQGKLKHLEFDQVKKTLTWRRPKADPDAALQKGLYPKVAACDIADIFRFVNERCRFLATMTALQPRFTMKIA